MINLGYIFTALGNFKFSILGGGFERGNRELLLKNFDPKNSKNFKQ